MFLEITLNSTRSPSVTANSSSCGRGDKLRFLCGGMIMLGLMVSTASVHADTVSINAFKDATIFGTSAGADTGNASGLGPGLFTGADSQLNIKRSLLQFDLAAAGIPAGSTIDNVTLSLSIGQVGAEVVKHLKSFDCLMWPRVGAKAAAGARRVAVFPVPVRASPEETEIQPGITPISIPTRR